MNCPKCKTEVKEGYNYCPKCGTEIPQIRFCSKCGAEIKDGMVFCPKCGCSTCDNTAHVENSDSPMVFFANSSNGISCPICNQALSINDQVCPNCHRELFYKCFSCNNDITYGEIIMNKGCCPKCGARIASLYNIPNEKYPFYVEPQIQQQVQEDAERFIKEGKAKIKKGLKYVVIGFLCFLVLSFIIGICSGDDVSTFSGNYSLECASNRNMHYIINVSKDGRCVGGLDGDMFLGYVDPISDNAFVLSDAPYVDWYLFNYRDGELVGHGEHYLGRLVFDIMNKRVYFNRNDYLNRDISNPEYCILSH